MSQSIKLPQFRLRLPPRGSRLRRVGCIIAVIVWFAILLLPCLCLGLASQGEFSVRLGDIPEQSLRIWLLSESRQRGIGLSRPSVVASSVAGQVCLQTDVSYLLWQGTEDATTYCDCFAQSANTTWEPVSHNQGACIP